MLAGSGCGGAVPAPKSFAIYNSTDGRWSCEYPKGWEQDGGGKSDSPNSWGKFTSGNAEIHVTADFAGSLFGDMAKAAGNAFGGDAEPAVAKVHPMGVRHMKEEYNNYEEKETKAFQSQGLGEGRRNIFTADQTLGGKVYGYRATLLAGDRRVTVVCSCPATNFKDLKPAFERVISSLGQGGHK
jgi:hypothetical protein